MGNYKQALNEYEELKKNDRLDIDGKIVELNIAVCMFYLGSYKQHALIVKKKSVENICYFHQPLGMYTEAQSIIETIPNSPLKVRLLFHLAHKLADEDRLLELHGSLRDVTEDQLSLASMHYLRAHYQDAIDIYKRVLLDKKYIILLF